ncbi:MAG: single-stranded-DNA-specific exonuclease RecJ [Candidatus Comchoanobacterales bacterium]
MHSSYLQNAINKIQKRSFNHRWQGNDIHPVLMRVLLARGCVSLDELNYDINKLKHFTLLGNINEIAQELHEAITQKKRILIVGDYDVDGATSIVTMYEGLKMHGAECVDYLVPNRFRTGYGLSVKLIPEVLSFSPDVIITVDNGIAAHEAVSLLKSKGIKVLITDHHQAGDVLPCADVIVNPNQLNGGKELSELAGVGVAFYVICALRAYQRSLGITVPSLLSLLDVVALGTVADCVPLSFNNRLLIAKGLERIRQGKARPGIYELIQSTRTHYSKISCDTIGFQIGPKLNAAGRLDDMSVGVKALLSNGDQYSVEELDALNEQRKRIQRDGVDKIIEDLSQYTIDDIIVVYNDSWHEGVLGLMASKIKDFFQRPTLVLTKANEGIFKGSGRSLIGINLHQVLSWVNQHHPHVIEQFGGHAMACGLSVKSSQLNNLRQILNQYARDSLDVEAHREITWHDGALGKEDLSVSFAQTIFDMGPWGMGFPEPSFAQTFTIDEVTVLKESHLKFTLVYQSDAQPITALYFNASEDVLKGASKGMKLYCVYKLSTNEFRGSKTLNLMINECVVLE